MRIRFEVTIKTTHEVDIPLPDSTEEEIEQGQTLGTLSDNARQELFDELLENAMFQNEVERSVGDLVITAIPLGAAASLDLPFTV